MYVVAAAVDGAVLPGLEALAVGTLRAERSVGGRGRFEDLAGVAGGEGLKIRADYGVMCGHRI